jgi:hypothetical protein
MSIISLVVFAVSLIVIFIISRNYSLRATPFVLGNTVGFLVCALMGTLLFSFIMDPSAVFTEFSLLGGGLGWTAIVVAVIIGISATTQLKGELEVTSNETMSAPYSVARAFWTLAFQGLTAVAIAILSGIVVDFIVFFTYGLLGLEITNLLATIAHIIYVFACAVISYFAFRFLFGRKAKLIFQTLYPSLTASRAEDEVAIQESQSKRKLWLWGCSGCMTFLLIVFCLLAGVLYPIFGPPPLNSDISIPSQVKQGDEFDILITLTNHTSKSVFIKDFAFQTFGDAPLLLDGGSVIGTNPEMKSEPLNETDMLFHYFRDIRPGETQTFAFHMKANNLGMYAGDIAVYAKHPFLGAPFFQNAQYFSGVQIEITQ